MNRQLFRSDDSFAMASFPTIRNLRTHFLSFQLAKTIHPFVLHFPTFSRHCLRVVHTCCRVAQIDPHTASINHITSASHDYINDTKQQYISTRTSVSEKAEKSTLIALEMHNAAHYLTNSASATMSISAPLSARAAGENNDAASVFSRPPMLPLIASEPAFINSTLEVLDAINYANNPAVRANLVDAARCWLSHIDDVLRSYHAHEAAWDAIAANSGQISFPLAITKDSRHLDPRRLLVSLRKLETDLSFHDQFASLPLLACVRVLKQIKEAAPLLVALDAKLVILKALQSQIATDIGLVGTVAEYFYLYAAPKRRSPAWPDALARIEGSYFPPRQREILEQKMAALEASLANVSASAVGSGALVVAGVTDASPLAITSGSPARTSTIKASSSSSSAAPTLSDVWAIEDVPDMMGPLFSALRALWTCSERFGAKEGRGDALTSSSSPSLSASSLSASGGVYNKKGRRFNSLTRFAIHRVELSVHAACWDAVQRVIADATAKSITAAKETVVSAHEAIVTLQEAFYTVKERIVECGPSADGFHLIYKELDDTMIFSNVEWQYRRLTHVLEIIDNLRENTKKIGSKLTDPFEGPAMGIAAGGGGSGGAAEADVMSRHHFPDHKFAVASAALLDQNAPDPDAIIQSIANKEAERQRALLERAPRYPLGLLTSHMSIVCSFGPPTVTVVGGPLSHSALDALQSRLPLCCANKIPDARHSAMRAEVVFSAVPNAANQHVKRLVIPEQYCETSVHAVKFVHTLLTVVDAENCWHLCGTHALIDPDFGETHYYVFKKVDRTLIRNGGPATEALEAARAELEALERAQ